MYFDIYYVVLVLPAVVFSLYAQFMVNSTFKKYSGYGSAYGLTAAQAAERILRSNGLNDVRLELVRGRLTDHYDPRNKVLRLSESVYSSSSVAAIGVAAHEAGHAMQHKFGYGPLALRSNLVPVAGIGSTFGPYMAIIGLLFSWPLMFKLGIVLFGAAVLFYLITLPVEFNASSRAVQILKTSGILTAGEIKPVEKFCVLLP
jgi:Zn-dependent membrane protease YugP